MKRVTIIILTIALFMLMDPGHSMSAEDYSDRVSNSLSRTFSPGYINVTKQYTNAAIRQDKPKSFIEKLADYIKNELFSKVNEDTADKPLPELKKKTGAIAEKAQSQEQVVGATTSDPTQLNLNIGSGTNQYKENGRLISEVIGGKRYVYAGFDNVGKGTISAAIALANQGDTVIVKVNQSGYQEGAYLDIKNGVNLLGGYSEEGIRNFQTPTLINSIVRATSVTSQTEISGFKIQGNSWYSVEIKSSNILFTNNHVINSKAGWGSAISITNSTTVLPTVILKNNVFESVGEGVTVSMGGPGSGRGSITSINNNYLCSYGIGIYGMITMGYIPTKSTNDYFTGIADPAGYRVGVTSQRQAMDSGGLIKFTPAPSIQTISTTSTELLNPRSYNFMNSAYYYSSYDNTDKKIDGAMLASIFKGILKGKESITANNTGLVDNAQLEHIVSNALEGSALSMPLADMANQRPGNMEVALQLADIIKNPTDDQKLMLDAIQALLQDTENQVDQAGLSELKKATDDLIQMVAAVLLAQALPDLLKEGDISNIKGIFKDLGNVKGKILLDYQESTKPYYESVKDALLRNIGTLQLSNIISKNITSKELEDMPRSEIDKIIEKMHKLERKSFDVEYILQEEDKAKSKYLDPNKEKLEENMKSMLEGFTKKIYSMLNDANLIKENAKKK